MADAPPDTGSTDTIVSIPRSRLASLLHNPGELDEGEALKKSRFKIRLDEYRRSPQQRELSDRAALCVARLPGCATCFGAREP
jgi:hypothetical protein